MTYEVLSREKTCDHLKDMLRKGQRVVINRFFDGEAILMRGEKHGKHRAEEHGVLNEKVRKAIKYPYQMVAINEVDNIDQITTVRGDFAAEVQRYLAEQGQRSLYYSANWAIHDYLNGGELIAHFLSGRILFVGAWAHVIHDTFLKYRSPFYIYATNRRNCGPRYEKYRDGIAHLAETEDFDTIVFACGPVGKVILTDIEQRCKSNLIDMGAVTNALIRQEEHWSMSWSDHANLDECNAKILGRLKG